MQAIALIADSHLAVSPDEAFWLFGRGGQSGWLLGAACDAVRPGAAVSLRLPAGLGSPAAVDILGRIGACVPGRIIEIVHDQPWQGRLRLKFKPAPAGGTRFSVSAELDASGLAWLMDRRGWAPDAGAGPGGIGPARDDVHRLGLLTSKSGPGAVFAVSCDYLARLSELPGGDSAERSFAQPWEIRAFAMAVAAYQQRQFEWSEFQLSLISSIRDWEASGGRDEDDPWSYYEHWVAALESVLSGSGLLSESALDEQTKQVLALPPNRNHHEAHTEPIAVDRAK